MATKPDRFFEHLRKLFQESETGCIIQFTGRFRHRIVVVDKTENGKCQTLTYAIERRDELDFTFSSITLDAENLKAVFNEKSRHFRDLQRLWFQEDFRVIKGHAHDVVEYYRNRSKEQKRQARNDGSLSAFA